MPINDCLASSGMTVRPGLMMLPMSGQVYRRRWGGGVGFKQSGKNAVSGVKNEASALTCEAHVGSSGVWLVCGWCVRVRLRCVWQGHPTGWIGVTY